MAQDITLLVICIATFYGGIMMMTVLVTGIRIYHLQSVYRRLLTPTIHIETIHPSSLLDTQEMKPVLRKIVSTDVNLHIQADAELEARTRATIHQHKRNLKRIIEHIASDQLAS